MFWAFQATATLAVLGLLLLGHYVYGNTHHELSFDIL